MESLLSPITAAIIMHARRIKGFWVGGLLPTPDRATARVPFCPFYLDRTIVIDRICYQVGNGSSGNVRVGIYAEGPTEDTPQGGQLITESASVAQAPAGEVQEVAVPQTTIRPGTYYLCLQFDNGTSEYMHWRDGSTLFGWRYTNGGGVYGPFTDPCPAVIAFRDLPAMWVHVVRTLPA